MGHGVMTTGNTFFKNLEKLAQLFTQLLAQLFKNYLPIV